MGTNVADSADLQQDEHCRINTIDFQTILLTCVTGDYICDNVRTNIRFVLEFEYSNILKSQHALGNVLLVGCLPQTRVKDAR